jgi:hypothetical protein
MLSVRTLDQPPTWMKKKKCLEHHCIAIARTIRANFLVLNLQQRKDSDLQLGVANDGRAERARNSLEGQREIAYVKVRDLRAVEIAQKIAQEPGPKICGNLLFRFFVQGRQLPRHRDQRNVKSIRLQRRGERRFAGQDDS